MAEKTAAVNFRTSPERLAMIDAEAGAAGLTRSEWCEAAASELGAGKRTAMLRSLKRLQGKLLALADDVDAAIAEAEQDRN